MSSTAAVEVMAAAIPLTGLVRNPQLRVDATPGGQAQLPTGVSAPIRSVNQLIRQVAAFDSTVLILGESGTGKEVAARAIHDSSCLLYTSPSPRDGLLSRMPSSA